MNFKQIAAAVQTAYMVTSNERFPVVPFLWGGPGVGKSACVEHVCNELAQHFGLTGGLMELGDHCDPSDKFGFIDLRLSQVDAVEIGGYPHPDLEQQVMNRLIGDWWPHKGRHDLPERGIIFFDEWTSAPQLTQAASYQAANDRRLGGFTLKDGWMVVGAGNRIGEGGVVYKQPLPLSNRMAHFDFESDIEGYLEWGLRTKELEPVITAYLNMDADALNTFETHIREKAKGQAFATERTWHRLSAILRHAGCDPQTVRTWAHAYLGPGVGAKFTAFSQVWQDMPDTKRILTHPDEVQLPTKSDVKYAVCGALAHRVDGKTADNAMKYLERMGDMPFTTLFVQDVIRRGKHELLMCERFAEYADKYVNQALLAA